MLSVHRSLRDVHGAVFAVAEGFLSQLLTARTVHNLEGCGGFPIGVPGPNERADRDHADHGVLVVLDELADRACQGSGQTHGAGCLQQHDGFGCPAVLGVELDGVLDDRLGCGGVLRQVGRADERHLGTVPTGDIGQLGIIGGDDNAQLVLTGKLFLRGQGLLDGPHHERLTRNRAQVLTRNALRAAAYGNDAENTHYASRVSMMSSAMRRAGSFSG